MKKAFNVYKTYGNSGISVAFRKFTLLLAFGVCVFGFQSQAIGQDQLVPTPGLTTLETDAPLENAAFLQNFIITRSADSAAAILRDQIRFLLDSGDEPDSGIEEVDYGVRMSFLTQSVESLVSEPPTEIYIAMATAFTNTNIAFARAGNQVDVQSIVESYARLLE